MNRTSKRMIKPNSLIQRRIIGIFFLITSFQVSSDAQVITIREAKQKSTGTEVTVSGIVTCDVIGNANVRNFQDATAGLTVYSSSFASGVSKGDSITITGTLTEYNGVLQLDPVASFTVHSNGNSLPDPVLVTPSRQHDSLYSMLVQVQRVFFTDAGKTFSGTTYNYTASGESGVIYVHYNSPLVGEQVPTYPVNMTGIASAYGESPQILVRDMDDFEVTSSIWLDSKVSVSDIDTGGFTLFWTTNIPGTTELAYGTSPGLELPPLKIEENTTEHSIEVSGRTASEFIYARPFSVTGQDTAWSVPGIYITRSRSSGDMKVYFNRTVDHSVSSGTDAVQLFHALDDTLVQYINRAKHSIDFTIYNYNITEIADITGALNSAHSRGVEVRIVRDNNLDDNAGWEALDPAIGQITSPKEEYTKYNIMHNKFVVFDALSPDPDDALVWTGSTNFTTGQINSDPNNVIIIRDQSLAKTFRLEFEEMFGSSGLQPDPGNSLFGKFKKNNTPHEFNIGGKRVECYFSPSDGVNAVIEKTIRAADHELFVNTMLITRDFLAKAIVDRQDAGVDARVIVNSEEQCTYTVGGNLVTDVVDILTNIGADFRENGEGAILHHKTLIVDQGHPDSDPLVLTGCHNWSSSADTYNDENTVIIHDATIANIYYQEFYERFKNGDIITSEPIVPVAKNDYASMKQGDTLQFNVLDNDEIPAEVIVGLSWGPASGSASVNNSGLVTYIPDPAFNGLDTMAYKVCAAANDAYCDSAKLIVLVEEPSSSNYPSVNQGVRIYPNPALGDVTIHLGSNLSGNILTELYNLSGKRVYRSTANFDRGRARISIPESLEKGVYILRIHDPAQSRQSRLILH